MALLDHFHPPLSQRRHGESFHAAWASAIADALNDGGLPEGFFAEEMISVGGRIEIDVATFDEGESGCAASQAVAVQPWAAPPPTQVMPCVFPDSFAVQVYRSEGGPTFVAAVEHSNGVIPCQRVAYCAGEPLVPTPVRIFSSSPPWFFRGITWQP